MGTFFASIALVFCLNICGCTSLNASTHIVLIGSPGSGKGTFSNFMTKHENFEHISPGDLLRKEVKAHTILGVQIQERVKRGELIPNAIVWELVHQKLVRIINEKKAFILDGFPISEENFHSFYGFMNEYAQEQFIFLHLHAPDFLCVQRICARRLCIECGEVYNDVTCQPQCLNTCDRCKSPLSKRDDDTLEHATKRVASSNKRMHAVIECIKSHQLKNIEIDTNCSIEECHQQYSNILQNIVR